MTQDTRKDRRVKIVSLNVRYKSATVDEFIENHAHDVSRGGIYIKTGSPFPPGTLLKFEIRLSSDQAVITGVGRVVWKRDTGQGTGERPSGMGVKFIKIDDPVQDGDRPARQQPRRRGARLRVRVRDPESRRSGAGRGGRSSAARRRTARSRTASENRRCSAIGALPGGGARAARRLAPAARRLPARPRRRRDVPEVESPKTTARPSRSRR